MGCSTLRRSRTKVWCPGGTSNQTLYAIMLPRLGVKRAATHRMSSPSQARGCQPLLRWVSTYAPAYADDFLSHSGSGGCGGQVGCVLVATHASAASTCEPLDGKFARLTNGRYPSGVSPDAGRRLQVVQNCSLKGKGLHPDVCLSPYLGYCRMQQQLTSKQQFGHRIHRQNTTRQRSYHYFEIIIVLQRFSTPVGVVTEIIIMSVCLKCRYINQSSPQGW